MFTSDFGSDYILADVTYPPSSQNTVGKDEQQANAHLIAAAPDLLAACEDMLDALDAEYPNGKAGSKTDAAYQATRAAIAKATAR